MFSGLDGVIIGTREIEADRQMVEALRQIAHPAG
jgi:hypothetical protein